MLDPGNFSLLKRLYHSFVHAPHSRERLRTTREMLMFILTYHQVLPIFLDFLFPFGKQQYTQDFQFSGFRCEDRLSTDEKGLELPQLGRSGRDLRMCYNLKSVEHSKGQKEWPWSIRQTAAYHSFDIETGKAFWVIIKGDLLMKKRIEAVTKSGGSQAPKSLESLTASFSSTLQAHLVVFDWCREHWRWYINFLEHQLQNSTRETLLVDLDRNPNRLERRTSQGRNQQMPRSPISVSEKIPQRSSSQIKHPLQSAPYHGSQKQSVANPRPSSSFAESQESLATDEDFSFSDLQQVQSLEEKANETILVIDSNTNTLSEVKQYYREIVASEEFPRILQSACARELAKFEKTIASIISDLQMQHSRTQMLLRLLTDRKSLVCLNRCQFYFLLTSISCTASWITAIWNRTSYLLARLSSPPKTWKA